ncbi:ABC transporter substrate-binding protein [Inquilinus limosus]|uniref:ABC transporter substrate-binding protein n=1 Tax=Inquilinus limosus TaxID=171674 RepID=UPI001EE69C9C|nr:ABC transporter substrate-binding protein [Inquilinus limosus]
MTARLALRRLAAAIALGLGLIAVPAAAQSIVVTDVAGHTVELPQPARRVVLGDGGLITVLALLDPEPLSLVAGWAENLVRFDPGTAAAYRARFPAIDALPLVGGTTADSVSIEQVLALSPDLVVLPLWFGPAQELERQLGAAGVPVLRIDFFDDPLRNTVPSLRALGRALGREGRAEAYIRFYEAHMGRIAGTLAAHPGLRPKVLLHARAGGWECCWSAGASGAGTLIGFAGGENIAKAAVPGPTGQLGLEYVLAEDPEVYIAAGGPQLPGPGSFRIGPGVPPAEVREQLAAIRGEPGLGELPAIAAGRAHALWLNFFHGPAHVVAVEAMAKWIHPELFGDLDPAATLAEINRRFLAVPMDGTYFGDLGAGE